MHVPNSPLAADARNSLRVKDCGRNSRRKVSKTVDASVDRFRLMELLDQAARSPRRLVSTTTKVELLRSLPRCARRTSTSLVRALRNASMKTTAAPLAKIRNAIMLETESKGRAKPSDRKNFWSVKTSIALSRVVRHIDVDKCQKL